MRVPTRGNLREKGENSQSSAAQGLQLQQTEEAEAVVKPELDSEQGIHEEKGLSEKASFKLSKEITSVLSHS